MAQRREQLAEQVREEGGKQRKILTGLRFFLISVSKVPALSAMISGAASGSWAMGEPQSEQNRRQTDFPELPVPSHFLIGPLMVSLSLGTTATRAVYESNTWSAHTATLL